MSSTHLTKLKRKATELEQKKQFDKALALYIQVIDEAGRDLDDADLQLFNRVGDLLTRQGNTSEALAYYEKAVDMYAERGFLNNAIALCNKILRQSPARTTVYYKLGKISASKGFKSDARKNFLEYADRMQKAGNHDEAFRALKEFADLCPDQDDIRLMLADLLTRENRTGEALEQLERLYAKLETEGRAAEARATMDRIKAIDPEKTPSSTGAWQTQKSNDLVFLDLGEAEVKPRAATPPHATPPSPLKTVTPVEAIDVSNVGALQGLTITFLPDSADNAEPLPALEGLDIVAGSDTNDALPGIEIPGLVTAESLTPRDVPPVAEIALEHVEFEAPDDIVLPVDGLARPIVELTGSHPSLAPLIEEPPLSGREFGALQLTSSDDAEEAPRLHDLALESSLPMLTGDEPPARPLTGSFGIVVPRLGDEETPDEWVHAALQANRDDLSLDRLLTPLDNRAISPDASDLPEIEFSAPEDLVVPGAGAITNRITGSFSVDELLKLPEGLPATPLATGDFATIDSDADALIEAVGPVQDATAPLDELALVDDAPRVEESMPEFEVPSTEFETATAEFEAPVAAFETPAHVEVPAEPAELVAGEPEIDEAAPEIVGDLVDMSYDAESPDESVAHVEASAPDNAPVPDEPVIELPSGPSGNMHPAWDAEALLSPEFALEESGGAVPHPESALDTASLRAEVEARHESHDVPPVEPVAEEPTPDADVLRQAFEEDRVELPLLDLEAAAYAEEEQDSLGLGFEKASEEIDDLLSAPASFGDGQDAQGFEPEPLDLVSSGTTDEWGKPEVLIDGEWRDEHVGDLVSGEVFIVGDRDGPPRPAFDDLSAAMLYDAEGNRNSATPSIVPASNTQGTPRSTLSFGGTEAQLRRRLELAPHDPVLRRQLGEALLEVGQREEGLNELELAAAEYETRHDLDSARDIVDVILRVVPLSVRHHQKRVEYAVRASDRPRLVEAYTELADSLFRCGEPEKASVVYSRVLELSPTNERARFALSMLADDAGAPRSSDEIPVIATGILRGTPSLTMAMLTPEALDALTSHDIAPAAELPYIEDAAPEAVAEPVATTEPWPATEGVETESDAETLVDVSEADALPRLETIEATHEAMIEEIAPPADVDEVDEEVEEAFASSPPEYKEAMRKSEELLAVEEWAAEQPPALPSAARPEPTKDFVDLGDWLRSDEPEKSTRMVARDVSPTGDEVADFAEMLRRFKQGVAANVDEEDFDSHYDLGVAYKEMGLIDEAIAQFQKALRGAHNRVRAYEALGHCFVEQAQYQVAIALLQRAAEHPGADDQELVGVLYLLGFACESTGRQNDAVGYYQRVFAVDIQFRDVTHRLAALARTPK